MNLMGKSFLIVILFHAFIIFLFQKKYFLEKKFTKEVQNTNSFLYFSDKKISGKIHFQSKNDSNQNPKSISKSKELIDLGIDNKGGVVSKNNSEIVNSVSPIEKKFEAQIFNYKEPVYPKKSIMLSEEGEVELRLLINKEGQVLNVELIKSSGHEELDKSAQNAAFKWLFKKNNLDQNILVTKKVQFKLN